MASGGNVVIRLITGFASKGVDLFKSSLVSAKKMGTKAIGAISSALGNLASMGNKQLGGLIGGFGDFAKMVAAGGVWGAAQFAVTKAFGIIGDCIEKARQRAKDLRDYLSSQIVESVQKIEKAYERVVTAITRAVSAAKNLRSIETAGRETASARASADANAKLRSEISNGGNASIAHAERALAAAKIAAAKQEKDSAAAVADARDGEKIAADKVRAAEKALAQAQANQSAALKKASRHIVRLYGLDRTAENESLPKGDREKAASRAKKIREAHAAELEAHKKAKEEVETATKRLEDARQEQAAAAAATKVAEEKASADKINADERVKEAEFDLAEAKKAESKASKHAELEAGIDARERDMLAKATTEAERNVVKATAARARARLALSETEKSDTAKYTAAVAAVTAAEHELAEAKRKQVLESETERLDKEQAEQEFEARQNLIEAYDEMAEQGRQQIRKTQPELKRLVTSIGRLKERLDEARKGIDRTEKGMKADARVTNGIFGPYEYGGRSNGGDNFTDWDRAQRLADRADRDAEKAERRDARAQKRFDRIEDAYVNGETVSAADEAFYDKFKQYKRQKNGAADLQKELEDKEKERDDLQKEIKKTLEKIEQNIKDALALA